MRWCDFARQAPELARTAEQLFQTAGVVLVGTTRKDGSPRISPVEPLFLEGELYFGMMASSLKAKDLLRDPRLTVHSAVADRHQSQGEFKLHGQARPVIDAQERERYCLALKAAISWCPEGPFPLFAVCLESAALFRTLEKSREVELWRAGQPVRRFEQGE